MRGLALLAGELVMADLPFEYYVGTDAHNEDKIMVWGFTIYWLSDTEEFYIKGGHNDVYYDTAKELVEVLNDIETIIGGE